MTSLAGGRIGVGVRVAFDVHVGAFAACLSADGCVSADRGVESFQTTALPGEFPERVAAPHLQFATGGVHVDEPLRLNERRAGIDSAGRHVVERDGEIDQPRILSALSPEAGAIGERLEGPRRAGPFVLPVVVTPGLQTIDEVHLLPGIIPAVIGQQRIGVAVVVSRSRQRVPGQQRGAAPAAPVAAVELGDGVIIAVIIVLILRRNEQRGDEQVRVQDDAGDVARPGDVGRSEGRRGEQQTAAFQRIIPIARHEHAAVGGPFIAVVHPDVVLPNRRPEPRPPAVTGVGADVDPAPGHVKIIALGSGGTRPALQRFRRVGEVVDGLRLQVRPEPADPLIAAAGAVLSLGPVAGHPAAAVRHVPPHPADPQVILFVDVPAPIPGDPFDVVALGTLLRGEFVNRFGGLLLHEQPRLRLLRIGPGERLVQRPAGEDLRGGLRPGPVGLIGGRRSRRRRQAGERWSLPVGGGPWQAERNGAPSERTNTHGETQGEGFGRTSTDAVPSTVSAARTLLRSITRAARSGELARPARGRQSSPLLRLVNQARSLANHLPEESPTLVPTETSQRWQGGLVDLIHRDKGDQRSPQSPHALDHSVLVEVRLAGSRRPDHPGLRFLEHHELERHRPTIALALGHVPQRPPATTSLGRLDAGGYRTIHGPCLFVVGHREVSRGRRLRV
ncbi:hypothetical protein LzC2_38630 [Planctomycetes bacterium LzC2]|uniref:Uncharacterized protein n=1 Tax=Alienimonas chondri TaxID=2681879 RepID=A0ABX1VJX0_9PLAN|nr:hypothetical protein [Alienimonas chondri]